MPSAISLKKLTASNWSAENEAETESAPVEADTAQTDKPKHSSKSKKRSDSFLASRIDAETILDEKRKRTVPPAELHLAEWFKANFDPVEDGYLSGRKMYELYKQNCMLNEISLPELTFFNRQLNNVLGGKKYVIKEGSAYKGLVAEKKKKTTTPTKKAESLQMKMKDIIIEALTEGGSPKKGLRFVWIKHYIIGKYPALRLDLKPVLLKTTLERAVKYGFVELVRGIGMVGFYRLPGEYPEDEEDEKKKKKKSKKTTASKEKENGVKEGEEAREGEDAREGKDDMDVNGKGEEAESEEKKKKDSDKAKKKKAKRKARPRYDYERVSRHVEPKKIDDTFPMAMTFMCEPKDASSLKIKKYIQKYFPHVDLESNFKKTLLNGCEKGLWEQVTGTGTSGSFRLQVDDINPLHCSTLEDMICLAILACHEPKQTSVNLLKQYIMEYHPNFNIDKRPYYFKMALEKAERKGNIIRLTGIGSTGSFQLSEPFTPCPNWLGGEEDSEIEEEEEEILHEEQQAYKARPSKRRGMGRAAAAKGRPPDFISYSSVKPVKPKKRKRKVVHVEEDEESEEDTAAKRSKSRSRKSRSQIYAASEEEEESEEEPVEYSPRKSASRGGAKRYSGKQKPKAKGHKQSMKSKKPKQQKTGKASKSDKRKSKARQEEEQQEERVEELEAESDEEAVRETKELPKKRKYRESSKSASKSSRKRKSTSGERLSKRMDYSSDEEEGEVQKKSRSPRKKARVDYGETLEDSEEEVRPSKSKGSASKRRAEYSDSEDEFRSPAKSRGKGRYEEDDDSLSEGEEVPTHLKSKKSSLKRAPVEPMYTDSEEEGEVKSRSKTIDDYLDDEYEEEARHRSKATKKSPKKSPKKRR